MSSKVLKVFIDNEGKPANIPDYKTIITQSNALRPEQVTAINVTGVRLALDMKSHLDVSDIWVKFGPGITVGEANTQHYVAQYLQANNVTAVRAPRVYLAFTWGMFCFIVSEFIDGPMCASSDFALVAPAVQALISIPSPSLTPGPVGGGLIEHPFFNDRVSSIQYESVEELQDHANGILRVTGRPGRVNFTDEVASHGLRLCVSDLRRVNFMRDGENGIVAVDFGGYSFLPPSFFTFALLHGGSIFALRMAHMFECPPSPYGHLDAMVGASFALVPYGTNDVGLPKRLKARRQAIIDAHMRSNATYERSIAARKRATA
ncbi:hypothetical protein CVT25_001267 [Psilocybe cyanescens]|uniref:Aminoglycoside phosphotransferase domain-containing protein n=1 Tax=Psilocybe cyanescens TaxID=93625 RepID=A0A409XEI5_PSICY|nr:hypothetical protein CVT25_001267 [Psilocybe cyanescens]